MAPHRETMTALNAPAAVGPYAQAIRAGGLLFCSGQIPLDPGSGELVQGGAPEQARRGLANLGAVCAAAGPALRPAARVRISMTELHAFRGGHHASPAFFEGDPPA